MLKIEELYELLVVDYFITLLWRKLWQFGVWKHPQIELLQ